MNENSWDNCKKFGKARIVPPDLFRAKSLFEVAHERINLINQITEKNCNFIFEDYYTSLIEILQAEAFKRGYNILNHICLGFYLKEILKKEKLYLCFNDLRYKRNSLTYYGNKMEFQIAKASIRDCKRLMDEITAIFKQ